MKVWKKATQTLGDIWSPLLMGVLLGTTTVLFISLPISQTNDSTLGENIFGKKGSLGGVDARSLQKVTGGSTMGHAPNSKTTLKYTEEGDLGEKSCPCTGRQAGSTMKKQDNSSSTTF